MSNIYKAKTKKVKETYIYLDSCHEIQKVTIEKDVLIPKEPQEPKPPKGYMLPF